MPKERLLWEGHRKRLRRRVRVEGWDALRPHEKVELVLNHAVPRQNLSDVARALVTRFGSVGGVFAADREALLSVPGMTERLAEWVVITGDLMRAYYDLHDETDIRLSCYQELLAFLRRKAGAADAPGLWALYADLDFNLITYTDFGAPEDCWDAAIAREMLVEAIGTGARYVYLVRFSDGAPQLPDEFELARLQALANTFRAADLELVDCVFAGRGAFASLRAAGLLQGDVPDGRAEALREAYLREG